MKTINAYAKEWELNAQKDAYWSVLSSSKYRDTPWDKEEFFTTGVEEIARLRSYIQEKKIPITFQGIALDFGCGVGRLSQALSVHFDRVIGVDISQSMVKEASLQAKKINNLEFIHNKQNNLSIIKDASCDFIYSNIVMQHIANREQLLYLKEFARILKPGGYLIVQIPSLFICDLKKLLYRRVGKCLPYALKRFILMKFLKNRDRAVSDFVFEVNALSESKVLESFLQTNLTLLHLAYTNSTEPDFCGQLKFLETKDAYRKNTFLSPMYFAQKYCLGSD